MGGGTLPTVGTGREASPSPRGCRQASRARSRQGRQGDAKEASWELPSTPFPADHTPAPAGIPARKPAKRVPSPLSPSPRCHAAAAQAPRQHRGSAPGDLFAPITGALFPSPGPRLIDWNLLKTN